MPGPTKINDHLASQPDIKNNFSGYTRVSMHSRTAIRFYEIHIPLTEAVLPDSSVHRYLLKSSGK
jgi:hypothetical protein